MVWHDVHDMYLRVSGNNLTVFVRRLAALIAAMALLIILQGCPPAVHFGFLQITNDCIDDARTLSFALEDVNDVNMHLGPSNFISVSGFVGDPVIERSGNVHTVIWELSGLPIGEAARCRFNYSFAPGRSPAFTIRDIAFFDVVPDSIGDLQPICDPPAAAVFEVAEDPSSNRELRIYNTSEPALGPVVFDAMQWVVVPEAFPLEQLSWDNTELETLPWTNVTETLPYYLYSGAPALISDIPDTLQTGEAALFRYIISSPYMEERGIWQGASDEAISTTPTTWGKLKTIYKSE